MKNKISHKKKFLMGNALSVVIFPLWSIVITMVDINVGANAIRVVVYVLAVAGLLNLLFFGLGLKYYYQVQLMQLVGFSLIMVMFLSVALWSMMPLDVSAKVWVLGGTLISLGLILRRLIKEPERWGLARKRGMLRIYLDEENWTFRFEIPNKLDSVLSAEGREGRKYLLKRLEKLHYLMPAIGMTVSRSFPEEKAALICLILIPMGLLYASQINIPLFRQFREWERARGKPLLLHESWDQV